MGKVSKIIIYSTMISGFNVQITLNDSGANIVNQNSALHFFSIQKFNQQATAELFQACYIYDSIQFKYAVNLAEQAIAHGANVNQLGDNGYTPLHWACLHNNLTMVQLLLKYGAAASINISDHEGWRPLYVASIHNNLKMVQLLLKYGAATSINQPNCMGKTALLVACYRNNLKMVQLFLNYGAAKSINQVDADGFTSLYNACENINLAMIKLLLDAKNEEGQPALDLSLPGNINALHHAIYTGQLHIVHAIIGSDSFNLQNSITVEDIINSLQDQNFVPREKENLFNAHYPALGDEAREAMIRELEPYLSSGLK